MVILPIIIARLDSPAAAQGVIVADRAGDKDPHVVHHVVHTYISIVGAVIAPLGVPLASEIPGVEGGMDVRVIGNVAGDDTLPTLCRLAEEVFLVFGVGALGDEQQLDVEARFRVPSELDGVPVQLIAVFVFEDDVDGPFLGGEQIYAPAVGGLPFIDMGVGSDLRICA